MYKDRRFFRILFSIGIILLLTILVGGIGKVWVLLTTGGNRADLLKIPPELPSEYTPKIVWLADDENTGRPMEDFNRNIIVKDYVRALYQRNIGLLTGNTNGLREYFTLDARPKVKAAINAVANNNISIEKAEMNHYLKLHFYSADGQLVTFTDRYVESRERVKSLKGQLWASKIEYADYDVLMQLDDGYWRIKHLIRKKPEIIADSISINDSLKNKLLGEVRKINGINYYPQATPWKDFWIQYDSNVVRKDFKLIKQLGFNTVRIFINFVQFGKGNVVPEMLMRLQNLLQLAEASQLKVIVTLFDFNSNYSLLNFPATDRQLENVVKGCQNSKALLAWDVKNEPDLDYHYQNKTEVQEWLQFIIKKIKKYDSIHPVTIGWAYPENAAFLEKELDFISFHFYKSPSELSQSIDTLKRITAKPLVLEEFGLSSYRSTLFPINKTETQQAQYYLDIMKVLEIKGGVSSVYWTLYDFNDVSGEIAGWKPWQRNNQKFFGIINTKKQFKPIAKVLKNSPIKNEIESSGELPVYLFTYVGFLISLLLSVVFYLKIK